ncbi:tetratricopeptide repeat protein 27 [Platysternon megacephalum]|uniref:Tetratricopeptide repeat protein 27 n=1 Tax=Platysternon megacephalum TaxID=55544 RepID=A0A4D9EVQ9_9SAUR|nr:tetratricopeptide repeat protein 27 [Platysternon megacephalum]
MHLKRKGTGAIYVYPNPIQTHSCPTVPQPTGSPFPLLLPDLGKEPRTPPPSLYYLQIHLSTQYCSWRKKGTTAAQECGEDRNGSRPVQRGIEGTSGLTPKYPTSMPLICTPPLNHVPH